MNERGQRNGPFQRERERTANKLASWPAGWIEEGCSCGDCVCLLRPYWEEEWCRRQQQQEEEGERRRMSFRARARGRGGVVSAFLRARARTEVPTKNECEWSWSSGEDAVPLTFFHFLTHLDGCARGRAFVAQNSRFLFKWVDGMPCKRIRDTKNAVLIKN